ncbi:uncharacterized protein LOC112601850 [Melanaphis sacchari]|uniref:uncharacterized protein LOC112601850 n=1 Tax=Melanaphis sacchari TaxID=742174 RepID=UPI000DC149A9|nr:uncharacterized protein LOC112601850 [Melanaphis sacchari]
MIFSKQNTIIFSFIVIFSLVQFRNCEDPDSKVLVDSVSNGGSNKQEPANTAQPTQINIETTSNSIQQPSATPNKKNLFCKFIRTPFNACKMVFEDTIKSIRNNLLKVKNNIISMYRPPVTTVNNVVG